MPGIIEDRIIGRRDIIARIMIPMYNIGTWMGAYQFIKRNNLPIRRTPSGRPMFLKHELIQFDSRYLNVFSEIKSRD